MTKKIVIQFIVIIVLLNGCIEPYEAKTESFEDVLVVNAMITNEIKQQEIILTRSFKFEEDGPTYETNAEVKIIENNQNEYLFVETVSGKYLSSQEFGVKPNNTYQLSIKTQSGKTYSSNPSTLKPSNLLNEVYANREISKDSIDGIAIYTKSQGTSENTGFYKFEYEETFKIVAPNWFHYDLKASDEVRDSVYVVPRSREEQYCYKTIKSTDIIIKNTNEFSQDNIDPFIIKFINSEDYSLMHRYSILVKQYVLSREAYVFYQILKDFSESESLFSENQPGFVSGNISSDSNPEEKVVGFFTLSEVHTTRIFFNPINFFEWYELPDFPYSCVPFSPSLKATPTQKMSLWEMVKKNLVKFQIENDQIGPGQSKYYVVPTICGDCNVLGTNVVPEFWID